MSKLYEVDGDGIDFPKTKLNEHFLEKDTVFEQEFHTDSIKLSSALATNMAALRTWNQDWLHSVYNFMMAGISKQIAFYSPLHENE